MKEIIYGIDTVSNFKLFGFATGSYMCKCSVCKAEFVGDKRAVMCLKCAIETIEESIKKNIKIVTLEQLLRMKVESENWKNEKVIISPEFTISVQEIIDNKVRIIVRPSNYGGETLDFWVEDNILTPTDKQ